MIPLPVDDPQARGGARNLEIKVRAGEDKLARARGTLVDLGLPVTTLEQRDTYFRVERGRLKLREIRNAGGHRGAELIAYERADLDGPRWSSYYRVDIAAEEVAALRRGLALTLGVLVDVQKVREVGLVGNTRVHLDRVLTLGEFIELESVVVDGDEAAAEAEFAHVMDLLKLVGLERVPGSYSDLLLRL